VEEDPQVVAAAGGGEDTVDALSFFALSILFFTPDVSRAPLAGNRTQLLDAGGLPQVRGAYAIVSLTFIFAFAYGPLIPAIPIYRKEVLSVRSEKMLGNDFLINACPSSGISYEAVHHSLKDLLIMH